LPSLNTPAPHPPRAWHALALTAAAVVALAVLRTDRQYASAPTWYWRMKLGWQHAADVVLAGDSRVYRGLDPSAFAARLQRRCVNFGFSAVALDDEYLDAVERTLSPASKPPVVILGVTPWSLTPRAAAANGFLDAVAEERRAFLPVTWLRAFDRLDAALRPLALDLYRAPNTTHTRATEDDYLQEFTADGWVASDQRHHRPEAALQAAAADHARGNTLDPATLDRLTARVQRWRAQGWLVLAFEPPTSPATARLTHELSGWTAHDVPTRLRAAGATWIEVAPADYASYDGSHLTADSARRLSRLLAGETAARFAQ
jgi:hypothetical protein